MDKLLPIGATSSESVSNNHKMRKTKVPPTGGFFCMVSVYWIVMALPCNDKVRKGIHLGPVVHTSLKLRATGKPRDDMSF